MFYEDLYHKHVHKCENLQLFQEVVDCIDECMNSIEGDNNLITCIESSSQLFLPCLRYLQTKPELIVSYRYLLGMRAIHNLLDLKGMRGTYNVRP